METLVDLTKLNLHLSILEPNADQRGGVVTLPDGGEAAGKCRFDLWDCPDPFCPCIKIVFSWRRLDEMGNFREKTKARYFALDLSSNRVTANRDPNLVEEWAVANAFNKALTESDRHRLMQWFRVSKRDACNRASTDDFKTPKLPDASDGSVILYQAVFPWNVLQYFQLGEDVWSAEDYHCVSEKCECTKTSLIFLRHNPATVEATPKEEEELPAVWYDFVTGVSQEPTTGAVGDPTGAELLAALKQAQPELNDRLKLRQLILSTLYLKESLNRNKAELEKLKLARLNMPESPKSKTGRNEKCPCGSGKKYKHCCR